MDHYLVTDGEHRRIASLALASRTGQDRPCAHTALFDDWAQHDCDCGDHSVGQHYQGRRVPRRSAS